MVQGGKINFPLALMESPRTGSQKQSKEATRMIESTKRNDHLTTKCQPRASQEQHKGLGLIYLLEI